MPLTKASKKWRAKVAGFTLFELIVVIVLIAVLSGILLRRFLTYQELAEKVAMEQTAGAIRSALTIQLAALVVRGRLKDAPQLATINPMNLLADGQQNYAGEFFTVKPGDVPRGSWYYDLKRGQLVYLVQHDAHFVSGKEGESEVRYSVALLYSDLFSKPGEESSNDVGGVVLKVVHPYKWNVSP